MIVLVWSSYVLFSYPYLLDRIVLALYAFQDFCLQWTSCDIVFRKTCLYGSRASQNQELGVSEFWQLFPTHILSLKSILGFCHGIAKGGDCKVEFIQPCVALFHAKFAYNSEIRYPVFRWESCKGYVWESVKNSSVYEIKSILTIEDSPKCHTCEACRKLKGHDS